MEASQSPDDPWWDEWPAVDASWLWKAGEGNAIRIAPTVLYKAEPGGVTAAVVEKAGRGRALIVFRSEEEAEKYRAGTGKNPEAEGWGAVTLGLEDLANVIEMHGCSHVAMPQEWTGQGGVDFFAAEAFIAMLEAAPMFLDALEN